MSGARGQSAARSALVFAERTEAVALPVSGDPRPRRSCCSPSSPGDQGFIHPEESEDLLQFLDSRGLILILNPCIMFPFLYFIFLISVFFSL